MARGDVRPLASLGREGGSLGQVRLVRASAPHECLDCLAVRTSGVGTGQANPAPKVRLPRDGELRDRGGDPGDVGTFDEPEAPAEALVKHAGRIARKATRDRAPSDRPVRVEIALMKPITVDRKPTQEGIEPSQRPCDAAVQVRHAQPAPTYTM